MTEAKHTKRPWKLELRNGEAVITSGRIRIARRINKVAYARLIRAAPELLVIAIYAAEKLYSEKHLRQEYLQIWDIITKVLGDGN